MRLRKLIATALAGAAIGGAALIAQPASATETKPTLAEILAASGPIGDKDWYDFDIINGVVGAIIAADTDNNSPLRLALDPKSPKLTVFLPNDRAFQALAADLLGWKYWFATEGKVAEGLLGAIDIATLEQVVLYHVHVGFVDSATALSVPRNFKLPMANGGEIGVHPLRWAKTAVLVDADRNDANPTLVRSKLDILASNGIAHGISLVLRPSDL